MELEHARRRFTFHCIAGLACFAGLELKVSRSFESELSCVSKPCLFTQHGFRGQSSAAS